MMARIIHFVYVLPIYCNAFALWIPSLDYSSYRIIKIREWPYNSRKGDQTMNKVRMGVIGSSWWADAMYLPPLATYEKVDVTAVCGRNVSRAQAFADRWHIPNVFTNYSELIESGLCDAVIIATANDSHFEIAMAALGAGLHVLCEKPLSLNFELANQMTALAHEKQVTTMVPFTYRYMPSTRYVKQLIDEGFLGKPYHLHMRYYAGYGRKNEGYNWRFDVGKAGSGALGDIGSHFLHLAIWFFGEIEAVCSQLGQMVERDSLDSEGQPYEVADDTAMLMLRFTNGAQGMIHATTLAYEDTEFFQMHEMDFHGSGGTLRNKIDWLNTQEVTGARDGEGFSRKFTIPDEIWGEARRDVVTETYKDMFRKEGFMVREFVDGVAEKRPLRPNFQDGLAVQSVLDAALLSHKEGRWVILSEISG